MENLEQKIQKLETELQDLKFKLMVFLKHTHNGQDSDKINIRNVVGEYNLLKDKPNQQGL